MHDVVEKPETEGKKHSSSYVRIQNANTKYVKKILSFAGILQNSVLPLSRYCLLRNNTKTYWQHSA
jgi:hypothetical protein